MRIGGMLYANMSIDADVYVADMYKGDLFAANLL